MVEAVINSLTTNLNRTLDRNLTIHKKRFCIKNHTVSINVENKPVMQFIKREMSWKSAQYKLTTC